MGHIIVRYKVKPDRAEENENLIKAVFAELAKTRPEGIRYSSYKIEDGLTFVHHAVVSTADGSNPLPQLDAFKFFASNIKERCDEPPLALSASEIGSYQG
jgi:hypothetical protein